VTGTGSNMKTRSKIWSLAVAALMAAQALPAAAQEQAQVLGAPHERGIGLQAPATERGFDMVALDAALERLAALDAGQARIVELRFFGGLSIEETAEAMGISPATVKRHWALARAWLARELES